MAPGSISELSLSDAVAFRVDFDGASRRSRSATGAARCSRASTAAAGASSRTRGRERSCRSEGSGIAYTVTLEPHARPWLFALDMAGEPAEAGRRGRRDVGRPGFAFVTRDQQLIARAPITQVTRYAQLSMIRDSFPPADATDGADFLRTGFGNPRTIALAREWRAANADDRGVVQAALGVLPARALRLHADPAAPRSRPGRRVRVRDAARLLRALRRRVRAA